MDDTEAKPAPRGLFCPECRGTRLAVEATRKPIAGVTVQYRRCSACSARVVTEIRIRKSRSTARK